MNTAIPLFWKGEQIRDFIYIDDLAKAHVLPLNLTGLHIFNVGTQNGTKVMDLVKLIFKLTGREVPIEEIGERKGDVPSLIASSEKIQKELGWTAEVNLEEGLQKTIDYFSDIM